MQRLTAYAGAKNSAAGLICIFSSLFPSTSCFWLNPRVPETTKVITADLSWPLAHTTRVQLRIALKRGTAQGHKKSAKQSRATSLHYLHDRADAGSIPIAPALMKTNMCRRASRGTQLLRSCSLDTLRVRPDVRRHDELRHLSVFIGEASSVEIRDRIEELVQVGPDVAHRQHTFRAEEGPWIAASDAATAAEEDNIRCRLAVRQAVLEAFAAATTFAGFLVQSGLTPQLVHLAARADAVRGISHDGGVSLQARLGLMIEALERIPGGKARPATPLKVFQGQHQRDVAEDPRIALHQCIVELLTRPHGLDGNRPSLRGVYGCELVLPINLRDLHRDSSFAHALCHRVREVGSTTVAAQALLVQHPLKEAMVRKPCHCFV